VRRPLLLLLAALAALVTAGCGERKIQPPPETAAARAVATTGADGSPTTAAPEPEPAATLLITEDFGATTRTDVNVSPSQSVIDALRSVTEVETAYGGRYVQAIDGLEGSLERARDWLFFVNGIESPLGATEVEVHDGSHVWWDYRRWRGYLHVPVVVGAWPEPFLHGEDGEAPEVAADAPLAGALADAGGRLADGPSDYRVRVGAHADLRAREPAWRRAAGAPKDEGLTVWIADGAVRSWDAAAGRAADVPAARAIAVGVRARLVPPSGAVLVVAGLDAAAAEAAAERIARDPAVLAGRYAVAFDGAGELVAVGGLGASP
jgi:hypothetical protein